MPKLINHIAAGVFSLSVLSACSSKEMGTSSTIVETSQYKPVSLLENEVPYSIGIWKGSYGNHRALVKVDKAADAVVVHIPWRRRDTDAAEKNIMVIDTKTGKEISNRVVFNINRESGDIVFQPISGIGTYEVYYLTRQRNPNPIKGGNQGHFPATIYVKPQETADKVWIAKNGLGQAKSLKKLTKASVSTIQALKVTGPEKFAAFNSFYPMEVIATNAETKAIQKQFSGQDLLVFPEARDMPIKMTEDLPLRWIKSGPKNAFAGKADKNEFFTFQLGVYALNDLNGLDISFSDLNGPDTIPASALRCFNMGGKNYDGKKFKKTLNLKKGSVQALWMGLDVPAKAKKGSYKGTATITSATGTKTTVAIKIDVSDTFLADKGDSDVSRLTRLRWLDSDIGIDDNVLAPFTPIQVSGNKFDILGRTLELADSGFPASLVSRISLTEITEKGREVLQRPVEFIVETNKGKVKFSGEGFQITNKQPGKVTFTSSLTADKFSANISGTLECDGYMRYKVKLTSLANADIKDIRLELPFRKELAKYLMGRLGPEKRIWKNTYSGYRPNAASAPIEKGMMYNTVWSGDYNAGLGLCLKNDKDEWNGDNKTKQDVPTLPGWENKGQGRYQLKEVGDTALISVHNGSRSMKKGEEVSLDFALLATPFKPITKDHWDYRIYHAPYETEAKLDGAANARVINVHHANSQNPYINYPFQNQEYLKDFINKAHDSGRKVKMYYTVRELTTRTEEFWALHSLGHEIFIDDDGYRGLKKYPLTHQKTRFHRSGYPWLAEHLVDNYRMRWHSIIKKNNNPAEAKIIGREVDASIATQGLCRWHNYYLEGLKYLMKDIGADGLYLDGIGYDREIMKRVRKTMLESGKKPMIDFHGAVHQNWMTLAPYLDSIWYGEGTRYDFPEDYWLVEISGIPFGLTGEILKSDRNANIHRGMLYGISKRLGWRGNRQSQHVWKLWDDFGIKDSQHIGYFAENSPIKTFDNGIKATVYKKVGKTLLCLASWNKKPTSVDLKIDWKALGLNPEKVKITAPEVKSMQKAATFEVGKPITVPAFNGIMLLLEEK